MKTISVFQSQISQNKPHLSSSSAISSSSSSRKPEAMARTFILWLHGLGDSGPNNEPIKTVFKSPEFKNTKWLFPSAPSNPVSCNYGMVMPSWFDILELPLTAGSPKEETSLLKAVKNVHAIIDQEISGGINSENVYICGFSQGVSRIQVLVLSPSRECSSFHKRSFVCHCKKQSKYQVLLSLSLCAKAISS